jgi:ubiquinone/menaquinone biosynthesis C-methylase UbiE
MENLEKVYSGRFNNSEISQKIKVWKILTKYFFQKYVKKNDIVLDLAAGYCEFINNIDCKTKIAVDISSDTKKFASKDVKVIKSSSEHITQVASNSIDLVFTSNFFEHLTVEQIENTLMEVKRVLKKNGRIMILQPNIKYAYREYWDYFDHVSPLSHLSMSEALKKHGFQILELRPRFLPYTTKSAIPKFTFLIRIYLKCSLFQKIMGKQMFVLAKKN